MELLSDLNNYFVRILTVNLELYIHFLLDYEFSKRIVLRKWNPVCYNLEQ